MRAPTGPLPMLPAKGPCLQEHEVSGWNVLKSTSAIVGWGCSFPPFWGSGPSKGDHAG